jgi:hypothetical protein
LVKGSTTAFARLLGPDAGSDGQDVLDALAVAAGLKPAAVVATPAIGRHAMAFGLRSIPCRPWASAAALAGVPAWYGQAAASVRRATPLVAVAKGAGVLAPLAAGREVLDEAEEAGLLGYPSCCVAAHAGWRGALDRLLARLALEAAGGSETRAARLVGAGWVPAPRVEADEAALSRLAGGECLAFTSILPCPACAEDPASPARAIARAMEGLALEAGLIARAA